MSRRRIMLMLGTKTDALHCGNCPMRKWSDCIVFGRLTDRSAKSGLPYIRHRRCRSAGIALKLLLSEEGERAIARASSPLGCAS